MKICAYVLLGVLGVSSTWIASMLGFDLFSVILISGLMGLVTIVHLAAFRSHKWGLFGLYSKPKEVLSFSLSTKEKDIVVALGILFLSTCISIVLQQ